MADGPTKVTEVNMTSEQAKKPESVTLRDARFGDYVIRIGRLYNRPGSEFELKYLFNKHQIGGDGFSEVYFRTDSGNIFMLDDQGNLLNANESEKHKKVEGFKLDKEELSKLKITVGSRGLQIPQIGYFNILEVVATNERMFSTTNYPNVKTSSIVEEFQKKVPPRKELGDWERDPITHKKRLKTNLPNDLLDTVFNPRVAEQGILQSTIYSKDKNTKVAAFEEAWKKRWDQGQEFGVSYQESPFFKYSSRGWKIHIAFQKGKEKDVAKFLFTSGLYFKVEGRMGTYFNGLKASGSTIYIGSYDNMEAVAEYLESNIGNLLVDGTIQTFGNKKMQAGSGSDIEIRPKISARFDVRKTRHGDIGGDNKYADYGMSSWTGFGGIALLQSRVGEVLKIEFNLSNNWNKYTPEQREMYMYRLRVIHEESKRELIKDFGQEFIFGSKKNF